MPAAGQGAGPAEGNEAPTGAGARVAVDGGVNILAWTHHKRQLSILTVGTGPYFAKNSAKYRPVL